MVKGNTLCLKIALVFAVFFVVGVALPSLANADTTCGTTGGGLSQGTNSFPGLTITKISDVVSSGAETSVMSITNTSSATKTLVVKDYQSRCLEHLGFPFRSGLGQCQYYWQPNQTQPQQTTVQSLQTITLAPGQSQNVTNIVNQYQNQDCGSLQLDTFLVSIDGVAVNNGQVYGSFSDLCSDCIAPTQSNLMVNCSANPNPAQANASVTFGATATGGTGSYTYSWSGGCTGSSSTCTNSFSQPNSYISYVTVTSGVQTASASCSTVINQATTQNNLSASCSASPSSAQVNNSVTFGATATGGTGSYTYSWSGACTGSGQSCSNTFATANTYTSSVNVTSGTQTTTASCSVGVTQSNTTVNAACSSNLQCGSSGPSGSPVCSGNAIYQNYQTWTCNNPGTSSSYCSSSTTQQEQSVCLYNQTCQNGYCSTPYVPPYTPPYIPPYTPPYTPTCSYDASERCVGNSVYWFDSCGNQGSVAQVCGYNQTCEGSSCVGQTQQNNTSLNVTKQVRDLSSGNLGWSSSVYATPGDIVQFEVIITTPNNNQYQYGYNGYNSNQYLDNVEVRDIFPANLIYDNSLTLNGIPNSGNIISGLNIGSISSGQTTTITYQAQVGPASDFSFGSSTLTNSVNVTSNTGGSGNASASVLVNRSGLSVATTVSTGLTNNPLLDSFFIPLMIALVGIWAYNAGLFGVSEWIESKKSKRKDHLAKKELHQKIAKIKQKETA